MIVDFDASAVKVPVARDLGPGYDISKTVTQALLSPLIESGAYEVLDRDRMQVIFREQNMKYSDRFDASQAVSYGRILSVDAIVTGVVNSVLVEMRKKVKGVAGIGRHITLMHASVDITAQVISTETSQIYAAPTATGEAEEEIASETSGSIRIPGTRQQTPQQGGSGSEITRKNVAEPTVQKAIRDAVQNRQRDGRQSRIARAFPRGKPSPTASSCHNRLHSTSSVSWVLCQNLD